MMRTLSVGSNVRGLLLSCVLAIGVVTAGSVRAQEGSDPVKRRLAASGLTISDLETTYTASLQSGNVRMITLRDVVSETLANNLDVEIARIDRGISSDEIVMAQGIYDLNLAMQAMRVRTDQKTSRMPIAFPGFTMDNVSHVNNDMFQSSLSQLTPYGSVFTLSFTDNNTNVHDLSRSSLINPYYSQEVAVGVVQPLLKNFGPTVTNSGIRIAKHQEEISRYGILAQIDAQVAAAMRTYWDLVFAIENLSVQQIFLKQADDLLRINRIKYDTGVLSQTDVLQAEAQVALAKERMIVAQSAILGVQDQLKRLMDPKREPSSWDQPIIPEDLPTLAPVQVNNDEAIDDALANRPELLQLREAIKVAEIGRDVADWQRLPQLDLIGQYGIGGGGDTRHEAWNTIEENDFAGYQAGLQLSYPLQNRKARSEFKRSLKSLEKAREQVSNLESMVTVEVRGALRQLGTGLQRIATTKSAVESEQAKLDSELKRFDVGMATSFEVLTFQKDLAAARVAHLSALVDYNKALIELDRVRSRVRDRLLAMGIPVELLSDKAAGEPAAIEAEAKEPEAAKSEADSAETAK